MIAKVAGVAVSDLQQAKAVVPKVRCVQDKPFGMWEEDIFLYH